MMYSRADRFIVANNIDVGQVIVGKDKDTDGQIILLGTKTIEVVP